MKKTLLSIFTLMVGLIANAQVFVDADATGNNDGTSWANAYTSLHSALFSSPSGSEIWVAEGTYVPSRTFTGNIAADSRDHTFRIVNNIQVYGGFNGTETALNQRDWNTNPSIISGDLGGGNKSRNIMRFDGNDNTTILDGFVVENGAAISGSLLHGGAIYSINASPTIKNCTFQNNSSQQHGGAIFTSGGVPQFFNCKMINNSTSLYDGGALYVTGATSTNIVNCLFDDNMAARYGGAVIVQNTNIGQINNCTFVNNTRGTGSAKAIFLSVSTGSPILYVTNCVFYNNLPGAGNDIDRNGGSYFVTNCFSDAGNLGFSNNNGLTNIISGAPFFTDFNNGDYSILCKSPFVNAGDTTGIVWSNPDLNGDTRVFGPNIDLGAYENTVAEIGIEANKTTICNGDYVVLRGTCDPTGYTWNNGVTNGVAFYPTSTQTYTCTGTATGDTEQITIEVVNYADESISAPSNVCIGSNATVTLNNSENGGSYYLRDDATDVIIDGPVLGNGSAINFNTNNIYSPSTYNIIGSNSNDFTPDYGTALDFDGLNDKITTTLILPTTNTLTFEAWIYPRSTNHDRILSSYSNNSTGQCVFDTYADVNNGRGLRFVTHGAGNNAFYYNVSNVLTLNEWNHVAATFDNGVVKLYVDGIEVGSSTAPFSTIPSTTNPIHIAEDFVIGASEYFNGQMDEVKIWGSARSASEIAYDMNNCATGLETDLIAYYNFEDGTNSPTLTDLVAGVNGTLNNMDMNVDWVTSGFGCGDLLSTTPVGYALDMDGANDYVSTSFALPSTTAYSIETWIFPRSTNYDRVISNFKGSGSATTGEIIIDTYNATANNGRGIRFATDGGSIGVPNALTLNAWNHVACVFDNGNMTIYVNGFEVVSGTSASSSYTGISQTFAFGEDFIPNTAEYLNGKMDEVRFWNKALNQTDIMNNMNNCLTGSETDLLAYYNFEEGAGTTVYDLTAGQNNGLMNNMDEATDWVVGQFACSNDCSLEMTQTVTINPTTIDNSTSIAGNTISSNQNGANYNWLDCDNSFASVGAINQDFTPSANGNYAVEITLNGCVDTSACANITLVGIEQFNTSNMSISPNPVKDVLRIETTEQIEQINIYNISGSLIKTINNEQNGWINVSDLSRGMYFMVVKTDKGINQTRFVKE